MKFYICIFVLLVLLANSIYANNCDQHVKFVSNIYKKITEVYNTSQDKTKAVSEILVSTLDMNSISKAVLGSYWKNSSEEQRKEFQDVYTKYLIENFADVTTKYFGKMEIISSKPIKRFDGCITTVTFTYDEQTFYISYFTVKKDDKIYILDMAFEGIRTVILHRDEFQSKIRSSGLDCLIEILKKKNT